MKHFIYIAFFLGLSQLVLAQTKQYKVIGVGFYNLENLFDTKDDPTQWGDDEFLPNSSKNWTADLYQEKLGKLAKVISEMATDVTPDGPAILGVAEVENRQVLEDLSDHSAIKDRNYKVIHYDSPDHRGIDVGLLYQPKYFTPKHTKPLSLKVGSPNGDTLYTRDILYVNGVMDGDTLHFLVNHWPSRRGGESATSPLREFAASINKAVVDSLKSLPEKPKGHYHGRPK